MTNEIDAALVSVSDNLSNIVRPVIERREGSNRLVHIGSSVVLGAGDHRLLVSAQHVTSGQGQVGVLSTANVLVPWPKRSSTLVSLDPGIRDADLTWADVDDDDQAKFPDCYDLRTTLTRVPIAEGSVLVAVGYPCSRTKVDNSNAAIRAAMMFVTVDHCDAKEYNRMNCDPRAFVVARYSPQDLRNLDDEPVVGAQPRGMSGGALFMLTESNDDENTKVYGTHLIAFLTEYHRRHDLIVATRVECLLDGLGLQGVMWKPLFKRA
jgi:hypothetical protein